MKEINIEIKGSSKGFTVHILENDCKGYWMSGYTKEELLKFIEVKLKEKLFSDEE